MSAFDPAVIVSNTLVTLLMWPVILVSYVATVELVLDHSLNALGALKQAFRNLLYRPVLPFVTTFVLGLVSMVSLTCCFVPGILLVPFSLLGFVTLCVAIRTGTPG